MKSYPIDINGITTLVKHDGSTVSPITDNITWLMVRPVGRREFTSVFPHTGLSTGSPHVFIQYEDGTILGTHGGYLLTKLPRLDEVNQMLTKHNQPKF